MRSAGRPLVLESQRSILADDPKVRVDGGLDRVFTGLAKPAAHLTPQPRVPRIPSIENVPVRLAMHGLDVLVEGRVVADFEPDALDEPGIDLGRWKSVDAGKQVIAGVAKKPGPSEHILAAVTWEQGTIRPGDHPQAVG